MPNKPVGVLSFPVVRRLNGFTGSDVLGKQLKSNLKEKILGPMVDDNWFPKPVAVV